MLRGAVLGALLALLGCGRMGFDALPGDASATDSRVPIDARDDAGLPVGAPIFLQTAFDLEVADVEVDAAGNLYVTGDYAGTFDLGPIPVASPASEGDAFVASLSPSGAHRWSWTLGATTIGRGSELALGAGGRVHAVGYFRGSATRSTPTVDSGSRQQALLVSFEADGTQVSADGWGSGANVQAFGIGVSPTGDRVGITGLYGRDLDFGGGPLPTSDGDNGYAAALNPDGSHVWSTGHNGGPDTRTAAIAFDDAGAACVTGRFFEIIDFGAGPATARGYDVFVVLYEPNGRLRWARTFGGGPNDFGLGADFAPNGDCVAAGMLAEDDVTIDPLELASIGGKDMWVARFAAATGTTVYALRVGGADDDEAGAVVVDDSGTAIVAGVFASPSITLGAGTVTNDGQRDGLVFGVSRTGEIVWSRHHGGSGDEGGTVTIGLTLGNDGEVIVSNSFDGEKTIGGETRTAMGGSDSYIYRFQP